jgi:hypothetical protein
VLIPEIAIKQLEKFGLEGEAFAGRAKIFAGSLSKTV